MFESTAGTKWNFLKFTPGLVGGHCIGVDPYYLTHQAEAHGYHPQVILAGRRINDGMGSYVAGQMIKALIRRRIQVDGARVLIMGLSFKENCPDLRNTRVVDVVAELREFGVAVDVHDPWADAQEAAREYGLELAGDPAPGTYDGIVLAVAHDRFRALGPGGIRRLGKAEHVLYDLKQLLPAGASDLRL
jgi:UDP-N-acetyl-D-galactosamine dehydrogenase